MEHIYIKGARQHNLKNIDVKLPRNKLVVLTGLSGSGKSSLAFDTLYAEGQRRYVESLSAYARQFLDQMGKPDVDFIEGLSPAISIEQKAGSHNPRSTVGTTTEIYDYLRLLFARVGRVHCFKCNKPISSQTISQMVDQILALPENTRIHVYSPIVRSRKGEYQKELTHLKKLGFARVRVDGKICDLEDKITLDKNKKHNIDILVDRLVIKSGINQRLADSFETAVKHAEGLVTVELLDEKREIFFSTLNACVDCGVSLPALEPVMFSFNSPQGACPTCSGLGTKNFFDPELVIPNPNLSLREGAVAPWAGKSAVFYGGIIKALADHFHFDINIPFHKLSEKIRHVVLYGSGEEEVRFSFDRGEGKHYYTAPFEGVIANLSKKYREAEGDWVREDLERYMNIQSCEDCHGSRLKPESLAVRVGELNIHEVTKLSTEKAKKFFETIKLDKKGKDIAGRILKEVNERLGFLVNVGLDYLTLDRTSGTLSGGESQRIRLATQIGSSLVGVMYILDEPSIGLHQRDNDRLLEALKHLRDIGNTVIVVEHDEDTMMAADHLVDMGPGAGVHGGYIVAQGTPAQVAKNKKSLTGQYLSGKRSIPVPRMRRARTDKKIVIRGASHNNLKNLDVEIPLGLFVCVTGVSGSGKSSLINDTLYPALAQKLYGSRIQCGKYSAMEGLENLDKVINIDQSPIGRTPRSNPSTYTGLFTHLRDLFAELPESKTRGYKPGRYSFNVKGGRCEACEGDGMIRIEMHFLPDVFVECEVCHGKRYNRETLEVLYKGKNISDILSMTVEQSYDFLKNIPSIKTKLETLMRVGLNYVELGQSATTLSGGEAQRVKLAKELSKRSNERTIYILDEPTTGLHFEDIAKLLGVLQELVDAGSTVIVIEHNLDVIKCADHVIDLGPEGGDGGGQLLVAGRPEEVAQCEYSYTADFLKKVLKGR